MFTWVISEQGHQKGVPGKKKNLLQFFSNVFRDKLVKLQAYSKLY